MDILKLLLEDMEVRDILKSLLEVMVGRGVMTLEAIKQEDTDSKDTGSKVMEHPEVKDSEVTPILDMVEASLMASKDTQEQENRMVSEVTPTSAKEEETKDIPSEVMISAVVILWAVGMMLAMAMLHLFHRWVLTDNNGNQYTVNKSTDQSC